MGMDNRCYAHFWDVHDRISEYVRRKNCRPCFSDFHPLAKQAKDLAAGACLVYAICTVIVGLIIFIPKWSVILF